MYYTRARPCVSCGSELAPGGPRLPPHASAPLVSAMHQGMGVGATCPTHWRPGRFFPPFFLSRDDVAQVIRVATMGCMSGLRAMVTPGKVREPWHPPDAPSETNVVLEFHKGKETNIFIFPSIRLHLSQQLLLLVDVTLRTIDLETPG